MAVHNATRVEEAWVGCDHRPPNGDLATKVSVIDGRCRVNPLRET
jgi:hypothetical protein